MNGLDNHLSSAIKGPPACLEAIIEIALSIIATILPPFSVWAGGGGERSKAREAVQKSETRS